MDCENCKLKNNQKLDIEKIKTRLKLLSKILNTKCDNYVTPEVRRKNRTEREKRCLPKSMGGYLEDKKGRYMR